MKGSDLNSLDYYFYIKSDIFNKKYPIRSDLKFGTFLFIHTGTLQDFILVEYNKFMVDRLLKIYKITKNKKLKKLHQFILFCNKNKMTLEDVMKNI